MESNALIAIISAALAIIALFVAIAVWKVEKRFEIALDFYAYALAIVEVLRTYCIHPWRNTDDFSKERRASYEKYIFPYRREFKIREIKLMSLHPNISEKNAEAVNNLLDEYIKNVNELCGSNNDVETISRKTKAKNLLLGQDPTYGNEIKKVLNSLKKDFEPIIYHPWRDYMNSIFFL